MTRKFILETAMCCVFASLCSISVPAQQRKFVDGPDNKPFIHFPRSGNNPALKGTHAPYRSYDGTNNNTSSANKSEWGATDIPLYREMPAQYDPGDPLNEMNGTNRPSPREISNILCDEPVTQFNSRNLSAFVYVWGQFLDHDISLTPQDTTEYYPVTLPGNEPLFAADIPFFRSAVHPGTGATSPRQQTNAITSWIDGSVVYGSDSVRANWLRTFSHGKLKTSSGNLLPWNTVTGEQADAIDLNAPSMANDADHTVKTFVAGDVRAAEHPGLTSLQTLFVREHNRICNQLWAWGYRNDEEIYQKARKQVGAIIQAITYQEFLPALGINLPLYYGYNSNARPDICNTFATAGYRLGHTMVADDIALRDDNCEEVAHGELDLAEVFFNPQFVVDLGIEPFLKGFSTHKQYETDLKINSVLRNFLFGPGFGIDLASLNIQRGRDHGLPDYKTVRQYYTGVSINSFSQITGNAATAASLQSLYGNVNNIDLWVGILAEDRMPGKSVGRTINAMLRSQFKKLRDGDFYFYFNDPNLSFFNKLQIFNTKLSDVLERNTSITSFLSNVFFIDPCPGENGEDRFDASSENDMNIGIHPNPVKDVLNVDIINTEQPSIISIYSSTGGLVKTVNTNAGQKNISIDVGNLQSGVYFLKMVSADKIKSLRFIKINE